METITTQRDTSPDTCNAASPRTSRHHLCGWKRDTPDSRDHIAHFHEMLSASLPPSADQRPKLKPVPIEDQGQEGSCVGNSSADSIEFLYQNAYNQHADFSRNFIYYNARAMEGTTSEDAGCQIRDAVKSLAKQGVCLESLWPYDENGYAKKPVRQCYDAALKNRATEYTKLLTLNDFKIALSHGQLVIFGFTVFESFESDAVAKNGRVPMPKHGFFHKERQLGGHAVLAVGYDDTMIFTDPNAKRGAVNKGCLIVRNSWGASWGDQGYFYLPYPFIEDQDMSDDFWVISKAQFNS